MALVASKCRLRELLDKKGISQIELSLLTGINTSQLNDYIHNRKKMSLNTAKTIAHALKVHIDDLYVWIVR